MLFFLVKQISSVFATTVAMFFVVFHLRSQVGGLPDRMKMEVIEPLRPRLIDEVGWKCAASMGWGGWDVFLNQRRFFGLTRNKNHGDLFS